MFHADLHPANLLIQPGDVVGYVDFGITGVLSHYSRRHLVGMTLAYTRADIDGMLDAFSKLTTSDPDADPQLFRAALAEKSQEWYEGEGSATVFKKNFTLVMLDMLTLSRKTGIWPERDVIKYIRSAIAADGLITRFAPGFNVGRHLEDVCQRWVTWESRRAIWSATRWPRGPWRAAISPGRRGAGATILRRIADGDLVARVDPRRRRPRAAPPPAHDPPRGGGRRAHGARGADRRRAAFGANMFTAEAILVGAALVMLAGSIRRLAVAG